jgi:hypothetical protein
MAPNEGQVQDGAQRQLRQQQEGDERTVGASGNSA